jgi:hypothetical protein
VQHEEKLISQNDEFAFLDRVKIKTFLKNEIGLLPPTPTPTPNPPNIKEWRGTD